MSELVHTLRSARPSKTKKHKKTHAYRVTFKAIVDSARTNPVRARVIGYFHELAADGLADWQAFENGSIRLR